MKNLDILHLITAEQLNYKYYFQSLADTAYSCNLLSETDMLKLQTELMEILAKQIDKWNKGESSSIRIEKAQNILDSLLFVIGVQLKSSSVPEQAVESLKSESLEILFEKGLKLVQQKKAVSRRLQKYIADNLLDTPNVYYRSTIIEGINGFFKLYLPQFSAHEIHITVDYPVYMGRPELNGIEFIEQYLHYMEAENAFCTLFHSQDIHHLLCGLTQDYCSVPMNLFEPVLLSALGLILVNRDPKPLDLTKSDIDTLYYLFYFKSEIEVHVCLKKALCILDKLMELPQRSKKYAFLCLSKLVVTIQNAVTMDTLDKIFLVPAYPEQEFKIIFSYGERMDDRKYQKLVEAVLQADSSINKVKLILQRVCSLADFLDIISDSELYREDFELLVDMLPPSEFVTLLSQYPNDDFLKRESEQLLYLALQKRKKTLSSIERQRIDDVVKMLRINERDFN